MSSPIRKLALLATIACLSAGALNAQTFGTPASAPTAAAADSATSLAPKVILESAKLRKLTDKGVLQLEFTVANHSDLDTNLRDLGVATNMHLNNINLIDFTNKRKYDMGDANGTCLCSQFGNVDGGLGPVDEVDSQIT